jgi:hypothetical protein
MIKRSIFQLKSRLLALVMLFCIISGLLSACTEDTKNQLSTLVAQAGQTAVAEGKNIAKTEVANLKATASAQVATQVAKALDWLKNNPPSPWDISWIPTDSQFMVNNIDAILTGSGLEGQGAAILNDAQLYGVNPAFALAMFRKEATFAASGSRANTNNNPGNIIATGDCRGLAAGSTCSGAYGEVSTDGRFGVYASMADGINAYFQLLSNEYKPGTNRNCSDITCIITAYCPPSDCDTGTYIDQITGWTKDYQTQILASSTR